MAVRTFTYSDLSRALSEACHQNEQGCVVSVKKEVGTNDWIVRAVDKAEGTRQGA